MTPTPTAYTRTAIALHWLMAFGLLATLSLGLYMADLPLSPSKLQLYAYHKWAGVSLFGLLLGRLAWRLTINLRLCPARRVNRNAGWCR